MQVCVICSISRLVNVWELKLTRTRRRNCKKATEAGPTAWEEYVAGLVILVVISRYWSRITSACCRCRHCQVELPVVVAVSPTATTTTSSVATNVTRQKYDHTNYLGGTSEETLATQDYIIYTKGKFWTQIVTANHFICSTWAKWVSSSGKCCTSSKLNLTMDKRECFNFTFKVSVYFAFR